MPDRTDLATFASTNLNASDTDVLIKDDANPLKIFKFQASGLPEGTTTIDASQIAMKGTAGNYDTSDISAQGGAFYLDEMISDLASAGLTEGAECTDAGSGNINHAMGEGFFRTTADPVGDLKYLAVPPVANTNIPNNTTRYRWMSYNGGTPQFVISAVDTTDFYTNVYLGDVHNVNGTLHIHQFSRQAGDSANRITTYLGALLGVKVGSGEIVTNTGTRNIAVTAGDIFYEMLRFSTPSFDSSGAGTFPRIYLSATPGIFTYVAAQNQWDNAYYDDGTGVLHAVTGGKYANFFVIREFTGQIAIIYGRAEYASQVLAEAEPAPASIPDEFIDHGMFVARVTFLQGAATPTSITTGGDIRPTLGSGGTTASVTTNHNNLAAIQGGQAAQYYHLTSAEYTGTGTGSFVRASSPNITTPTGIVKNDVGLGNVDNTSDANKPVSSATQTALDLRANKGANSDITSLSGLTTPLSAAQGGTGNIYGESPTPSSRFFKRVSDFCSAPLAETWSTAAIASGTTGGSALVDANHIGVVSYSSSTTANSGYRVISGVSSFSISGGEASTFIFRTPSAINSLTKIRLGFQDSLTEVGPVDGIYIDISGAVLKGDCRSNSVETATATTYTLVSDIWYRTALIVDAAASLVTFILYSEGGTVLWTNTVASNIPTGTARATGHGIIATNSGTTVVALLYIDYMDVLVNRVLTR